MIRTCETKCGRSDCPECGEAARAMLGAPPPVSRGPCLFRGDAYPGHERALLRLEHSRDWRRCMHPEQPLGEAVCSCRGCGPACPGYTPDPHELPTGWLAIPPAPSLNLYVRSAVAVVTVATGASGQELLAVSGPLMQRFAKRIGADFVTLDWPGHPTWPMSSKFAIPRVLDHYDRILYVDADVLLRPGCVNPLDMCGEYEFGACDELPWHRAQPRFGREQAYQRFRAQMGFNPVPHLPWYFNAGMMVVPRTHRHLLEAPVSGIPPGHCAEQDHTNAQLLDSGMPYRMLDRRCNWQNWTDHGFRSAPADAILHWSGAGQDRRRRVEDMQRLVITSSAS